MRDLILTAVIATIRFNGQAVGQLPHVIEEEVAEVLRLSDVELLKLYTIIEPV